MSKGFVFTFSAAFFWAVVIILTRMILGQGMQPMALFFWLGLCELPFWIFLGWKQRKAIQKLQKKDFLIFGSMVLFSTIGGNVAEFFALANSPAVNYSFLIRTTILFTILFAWLFLGEKLTRKKLIIAGCILVGSYFLTTNGKTLVFTKGDIFTLSEAALIAFANNILGKMATNRLSPWVSAAAGQLLGFLGILAITMAVRPSLTLTVSPVWLVAIAISGVVLTLCRFQAYAHAQISFVTMVFSFTPVFVTLMAVPLLKEALTPAQMIGGALIIAGGIAVEKLKM